MEDAVRQLAFELLDHLVGQTHVDFVEVFRPPVPRARPAEAAQPPGEDADYLDGLVGELHEEVATGMSTGMQSSST